jgi:hypothetical protein
MKLYEQVDKASDNAIWILYASYKLRKELEAKGWEWLQCGRCYVTNNLLTAIFTSRRFKLETFFEGKSYSC